MSSTLRRSLFALLGLVFMSGFARLSFASDSQGKPVRGVWVANVASGVLSSPESIRQFVSQAKRCGLNTLYVVVWNRGATTYPSAVMQREVGKACDPRYADFDVLKEFVSTAHAEEMRVIAWFEFGFSCSYRKPDGGLLIRKHPDWAAKDSSGKLVTKNGFQWMNAFRPEVQDFLLSLIHEVLENYEVDGIQGDDRLPACPSTSGYDAWTVELYQNDHEGASPPEDPLDPDWVTWRANLLNRFMERLHHETKAK
ncbi:MAG: family 10 glycosylhydrolase, partial [Lacipirellulaceae bacterium]